MKFANGISTKICQTGNLARINLNTCLRLDKVAYMTESGPLDETEAPRLMTGKLLVVLKRLRIFDNTQANWFSVAEIVSTDSDNFLKSKFSSHLASVVETGIGKYLKQSMFEKVMRSYVKSLFNSETNASIFPNNLSESQVFNFMSLWIQNGCFILYKDDVCNLNLATDEELPVKLEDLSSVWILFTCLLVASAISCIWEYFYHRDCK